MTEAARAMLAHVEEALETVQYYMRAYEQESAFECELIMLEALNAGVRLTFPLPTAALRNAPNWPAVRALSLALTVAR